MTTSLGKNTSSAKTSRYEVSFFLFHLLRVICLLFGNFFSFWQNDGLHYRKPWVIGVQEEVERLKLKVLRHENLLRECEALKVSLFFFRSHKNCVSTIFLTNVFWFVLCLFRNRLKCWSSGFLNLRLVFKLNRNSFLVREHSC